MAINERRGRETSVRSRVSRVVAVVVGASVTLSAAASAAAPPQEPEGASATQGTAATPETPVTPDDALSLLQPGDDIRVGATGADLMEGRLVAISDGRLVLDRFGIAERLPKEIPIRDVRTISVRGRGTGTGAIVGATLGGLAAAAFAVLLSQSDSCCSQDWPDAVVVGLFFGGVVGAIPGGLVGAALPQWHRVYSAKSPTEGDALSESFVPVGEAPPKIGRSGSVALHISYNRALDAIAPGGGSGWRLSWTVRRGTVSPSLEIGRYHLGSRDTLTARGEGLSYEERLLHFGPAVAVGPSHGTVRPYALASLGYYRWQAFDRRNIYPPPGAEEAVSYRDFLGGSVGGGVRLTTGALSGELEGRWHTNISRGPDTGANEPARRLSLLSLNAGASLSW
jgi:hypothetical protein